MDYRTSIDLSGNDAQLVLASQEMGTFYCIYAQFKTGTENGEYNVRFELINYKGHNRLKIKDVQLVSDADGVKHVKVFTTLEDFPKIKNSIPIKLSAGDLLICQRFSSKTTELSAGFVSEESFQRFENERGNNKTPYQMEQELATKYINDIKIGNVYAASKYFCVIGFSQVVSTA